MTAAVPVRHATLTLSKREQWYEDIRPSIGGSDFNPLAASGEAFSCTTALFAAFARLFYVQRSVLHTSVMDVRCSEKVRAGCTVYTRAKCM